MTVRFLALALAVAPFAVSAQTPVSSTQAAPPAAMPGHLLEIRDGGIFLDGISLPDAVPEDLDLRGLAMSLDYSGPLTPVIEVDEQFYVLEQGHLVQLEQSTRAGERVYILGQPSPIGAMDDDRMLRVSNEAYLRELAERDRALYLRMQDERALEDHVADLAQQVRRAPAGAERIRLRSSLRGVLGELFELKQQVRREEVDRAQAELDTVRSQLNARDARQEAIIDSRLHGLCGE